MAFVLANPALEDLVNRHRIEVMQLFAPLPDGRDQVCRFQQAQVLRDRLPRHFQMPAQLRQRLPAALAQLIIICNLLVACQARFLNFVFGRSIALILPAAPLNFLTYPLTHSPPLPSGTTADPTPTRR
jgi:hypothetical protein